jgi:hypothetical protein
MAAGRQNAKDDIPLIESLLVVVGDLYRRLEELERAAPLVGRSRNGDSSDQTDADDEVPAHLCARTEWCTKILVFVRMPYREFDVWLRELQANVPDS